MILPVVARFALLPTAILWLALLPAIAAAESPISVREAHRKLADGEMILLDIRSPAEWKETGVAEGAWPVTMHSRQFGEKLGRIVSSFPDKTIGLICAVGGRSGHVWEILNEGGIKNFADLPEGMMGSDAGLGWLGTGLPVVPVEKALESLPQFLSE